MKKLVYTYEVHHYLPEEEQELTFKDLHHKHFEHHYSYFGCLKDTGIHDNRDIFVKALGMELRDTNEEND